MKYYYFLCFLHLDVNIWKASAESPKSEGIVGGTDTRPGQFNYQVSVQRDFVHACGGGMVNIQFVVTAAHCFISTQTGDLILAYYSIAFSVYNVNAPDESSVTVKVKKVYVHVAYNPSRPNPEAPHLSDADFAVAKVNKKLHQRQYPHLHHLEISEHISYSGSPLKIAGHGYNEIIVYQDPLTGENIEQGQSDGKLRAADVWGLDDEECSFYPLYYAGTHLCARMVQRDAHRPEGSCFGDSGSPLVLDNRMLVGILSTTDEGCREDLRAAIYVRVSYYATFIRNALKEIKTTDMRVANWKKGSCFNPGNRIEETMERDAEECGRLVF